MSSETSSSPSPERQATLADVPVLLFVRGIALLSVLLGVMIGLHDYLGLRLIRDAGVAEPWASVAWVGLWSAFGSIFVGFIGGRVLPKKVATVAQWVGFGWMGAFGLLLVSTAATDLGFFIVGQVAGPVPDEWRTLRALGVLALVVPSLAYGFVVARRPVVKRLTVDIPGLGAELDGLRIVQISDIHIGETLKRDFAQRVTDTVNGLKPDVVAVTGDMIDGSVARLRDEVAPFSELSARFGVFFVTGNHEYYSGGSAWEGEARRLGMTVLHNEHRVVQHGGAKLVVGGVTDVEGARFSESHAPRVDLAFAGAPDGAPRVLLAHQPRFAKAAASHQVSLMLSGHTHGGQIFPFMPFVRLQQPVVAGFTTLSGVPTYTSSGTGYWGPPFRIGARGEVTELTLRASPS